MLMTSSLRMRNRIPDFAAGAMENWGSADPPPRTHTHTLSQSNHTCMFSRERESVVGAVLVTLSADARAMLMTFAACSRIVTYRESRILFDPVVSSRSHTIRATRTICHEIAHM